MNYSFSWDSTAIETYVEETEFILYKWNYQEVENFKILVDQNLKRLAKNLEIGRFNSELNFSYLVISKFMTVQLEKTANNASI